MLVYFFRPFKVSCPLPSLFGGGAARHNPFFLLSAKQETRQPVPLLLHKFSTPLSQGV